LKENIQMLLVKNPKLKDIFPNESDWKLFKDLDQFLYQFNEATIELSSQKYPTVAHSRVILLAIKKDLEIDYGNDYLLNDVVKAISFSIEKSMKFFLSVRLVAGSQKASYWWIFVSVTQNKLTLNFIGRLERPKPGRSTKLDTLTEWIG
ncbi:3480_t:CDS:2, partial [Funneliformis caledonium]